MASGEVAQSVPRGRWLREVWASTIGKKVVVATSGAILVAYVVLHMVGNLTVLSGNGGGGGGVLAVVLLIIVVLVLLFLFRGQLGLGGDKTEVQVPDKIDVNIN